MKPNGLFCCKKCNTEIASRSDIESKGYKSGDGTGYLFTYTINLELADATTESFITGTYETSRASCITCKTKMGWKYISAENPDNNKRVGRYVLSRHLLKSFEGTTDTTDEEQVYTNHDNEQNYPDGWFIWVIDGSLLKRFRSSKKKQQFVSSYVDRFGIKFGVRCYPNGFYEEGKTDIDIMFKGICASTKVAYSMICNEANNCLNDSIEISEQRPLIEIKKAFDYDLWNQTDAIIIKVKIHWIFEKNDPLQFVTWKLTNDQLKSKTMSNEFTLYGISWILVCNSLSFDLKLNKCFSDSLSVTIYRKIECENANDRRIIVYNVDNKNNIESRYQYDEEFKDDQVLEIKCHIQLLSVEYKDKEIQEIQKKKEPKLQKKTLMEELNKWKAKEEDARKKQLKLQEENKSLRANILQTQHNLLHKKKELKKQKTKQFKLQKENNTLKKQVSTLQTQHNELKSRAYVCASIITQTESEIKENDEQPSNDLQAAKYGTLFVKHEKILNEWNANTIKLDEFSFSNNDDETKLNISEESSGLILLQQNIECNELIDEQKHRLSEVASDTHLLELLRIQNELITQQKKLENASLITKKQLSATTKQYQLTQNKRRELQKLVEEQINLLNNTIHAENKFSFAEKEIQINVDKQDEQIEEIKLLLEECASLVNKYNDFMQINQTNIDKSTSYFKSKWDE
eukprot:139182_1